MKLIANLLRRLRPTRDVADQRRAMRDEFFSRFFLLGGWPGSTDTYKRTMWSAVPDIACQHAAYHLTMRKGLPEPGADNQLVMAGHEWMLAQWFYRPLKRSVIEMAGAWYSQRSAVTAYPQALWDSILARQPGEDIYLPIDVWGFPGGQTFLAGVPCLSFEGIGGAISYLEPAMCRYYAPVIQATKACLMRLATTQDAEFGMRAAPDDVLHIALLLARFVGSGGTARLTSNDLAEFLYPELFKSIGTIGHEMMCSNQRFDKSLAESEYEMMDRFVTVMGKAALLCDLVDAETVGLENAIRVMKAHPGNTAVGIRVDSGDIRKQCALYFERIRQAGLGTRLIVFEDEVTPDTVREVCAYFREQTGQEPSMLFPGAGGYWWRLVHRDTLSAAFKRSATEDRPNVKFSNSPGKESLPGYVRVYAQDDTLVVADSSEKIDGKPLFVKLVDNGRIIYQESFGQQAERATRTWGRYRRFVLSDKISAWKDRFIAMRTAEVSAVTHHAAGGVQS